MAEDVARKPLKIAHISDIHVGSGHFVSNLLNRAITEINEVEPDLVLVSGDLTNDGFRQQYSAARAYLDNIECDEMVVIPGNHDSRNVGYVHFEDMFGQRNKVATLPGITMVALDSSQPDLNEGRLGLRSRRARGANPDMWNGAWRAGDAQGRARGRGDARRVLRGRPARWR